MGQRFGCLIRRVATVGVDSPSGGTCGTGMRQLAGRDIQSEGRSYFLQLVLERQGGMERGRTQTEHALTRSWDLF
jgi:hypothetical protein